MRLHWDAHLTRCACRCGTSRGRHLRLRCDAHLTLLLGFSVAFLLESWPSRLRCRIFVGTYMSRCLQMWDIARSSAGRAAATAAALDHDFAFVPAAYNLLFFVAVGFKGQTFELKEMEKLLEDIGRSERRLEAWGLKEHILFDCQAKRWLIALRGEWKKHTAAKNGGAKTVESKSAKKKKRVTMEDVLAEEEAPLPEGHIPVTDWRVFDQRFYGFYVWLEPPLQKDETTCAQCSRPLMRVHRCAFSGACSCVSTGVPSFADRPQRSKPCDIHCSSPSRHSGTCSMSSALIKFMSNRGRHAAARRPHCVRWCQPTQQHPRAKKAEKPSQRARVNWCRCTTCKNMPYCSAMCAQAHMFDHDCDEAPRPWLAPPVGPDVKPPAELGEEGFLGFIPWAMVKYIVLVGCFWAAVYGWRWFDDFRCAAVHPSQRDAGSYCDAGTRSAVLWHSLRSCARHSAAAATLLSCSYQCDCLFSICQPQPGQSVKTAARRPRVGAHSG